MEITGDNSMRTTMHLPLRAQNSTFKVGFPVQYTRNRKLAEGDILVWIEEDDGSIRGKIVKNTKLAEMAVGLPTVA
jgi:hypothetical protein